eukprot:CAMPEP_0184660282 /NCGR_PEP_ID=MMETSP0308-20130426/33278_1 /TAXON_ID=38269 /ORGANISM="Gloeochaete witrockiana, Strain SAG 46.84" /LENGTH=416 /DNA_ID=CAMNT_0027100759 /DNA_START=178 /DNA_END=1431 /DNA_ORIENTATION=-
MKSSHKNSAMEGRGEPAVKVWRRPRWLMGFSLFGGGNVLNFVAFSYAAVSLLSAVGTVQLVSNVIFARFFVGEIISWRAIACTSGILCGVVLVVLSASHDTACYTVDELRDMLAAPPFLMYEASLVISVVVLAWTRWYAARHDGLRKVHALSFAAQAAIIGTQSVVLAKCCSQLLALTLHGSNQFANVTTYIMLVMWIVFMVYWLSKMNKALKKYDVSFIVPVLQCAWAIFSTVAGGVYFSEFSNMSPSGITMFVFGMVVIMVSVFEIGPAPSTALSQDRTDQSAYVPLVSLTQDEEDDNEKRQQLQHETMPRSPESLYPLKLNRTQSEKSPHTPNHLLLAPSSIGRRPSQTNGSTTLMVPSPQPLERTLSGSKMQGDVLKDLAIDVFSCTSEGEYDYSPRLKDPRDHTLERTQTL